MRIGLNCRHLADPVLRGWNRYTVNLIRSIQELGHELVLYSEEPIHHVYKEYFGDKGVEERVSGSMNYGVWEQNWLAEAINASSVQVFHCPVHFGLPATVSVPTVLTIHDCIDETFHAKTKSLRERFSLANIKAKSYRWIARTKADHIIAVSKFTSLDVQKIYRIPENKITVVYEAADESVKRQPSEEECSDVLQRHRIKAPYFFYIGGWEDRKNVPLLVRALAVSRLKDIQLVLAGGSEEDQERLYTIARDLRIESQVRLLQRVEERDLPALFSKAQAFIYPSLYEGFGLQLVEAMAHGTPVLAADSTSLAEVLGTGGALFKPDGQSELAALMQRVFEDREYLEDLQKKSKSRGKDFDWSATAHQTIDVYKKVLEG